MSASRPLLSTRQAAERVSLLTLACSYECLMTRTLLVVGVVAKRFCHA
jgi:hypothetical protein